jgi:hypothetical protein
MPDMMMKSAFFRNFAPVKLYEKSEFSCNALDLAVILGMNERMNQ